MDRNRIIISLFFALVLLIGTGVSSIHIHIDNSDGSETVHQLVEDDFQCVICGSVFKFSPQPDLSVAIYTTISAERCTQTVQPYETSVSLSFDGRAPPYTA